MLTTILVFVGVTMTASMVSFIGLMIAGAAKESIDKLEKGECQFDPISFFLGLSFNGWFIWILLLAYVADITGVAKSATNEHVTGIMVLAILPGMLTAQVLLRTMARFLRPDIRFKHFWSLVPTYTGRVGWSWLERILT